MEEKREFIASVILCTYGRPFSVIDTLHSLARQLGLNDSPYEIIVVDNNADDKTEKRIKEYAGKNETELARFNAVLRVIKERRKGLSYARNAGLLAARAPIVAFTDDDMTVDNFWLSIIVETFKDPEVVGVFGYTRGATSDYFISTKTDPRLCDYKAPERLWEMGHGNNMAFRRSEIIEAGLFDESLGAGGRFQAAEDTDLFYRLLKSGKLLRYQPAAIATHFGHLHEDNPHIKMRQYGVGAAAFAAKHLARGDLEPLKLALKRLEPEWKIVRPYLPFSPLALIKDQRLTLISFAQQAKAFVEKFSEEAREAKK